MKKIRLAMGILAVIIFFAGDTAVYGAEEGYQGSQIALSWTDDPAHSQTVSWTTSDGAPGYIRWAVKGSFLSSENQAKAAVTEMKEKEYYRYEARIKGLSQNTTYIYSIGNGISWSEPRIFRTAPERGHSWLKRTDPEEQTTFLYLGDAQFAENRENGDKWGKLLSVAREENPDAAFALIGGDLVNDGRKLKEWELFFEQAQFLFSEIPLMPALGNHEAARAAAQYRKMFALPENGPDFASEEFYSFDYGACHIVSLNSSVFMKNKNIPREQLSEIKAWIQEDLSHSDALWKIVMLHHPPYGAATKSQVYKRTKADWCSVFSETGVDLVLCGHQHLYLRTKDIEGVTYIMGNSGPRRSHYFDGDNVPEYVKRLDADSSTYQVVTASEEQLSVASYNRKGQVIDRWTKNTDPPPAKGRKIGIVLAVVILAFIFVRIFLWRPNTEPKHPY